MYSIIITFNIYIYDYEIKDIFKHKVKYEGYQYTRILILNRNRSITVSSFILESKTII